ncbi:MAG TPA: trigger factor [Casimicrobiaceae bacterium]|nr:trigger factor [Casimicrobiaceae bacterium]
MQTTLETLGQLERRLHVALPKAQIEDEVQKRLAELAKTAKVPGFRPGKVPLKMVAQQYGPKVRSDVISDTVQSSLSDALRTQNLRVAGYPRIEPRPDVGEDEFGYSAVFEVYPEITLGELSAVTIIRPVAEVGSADVDNTIEILRKQRARYEPVSRAAQADDRALVDFTGTIDGVEFPGGQAREFTITLGEGKMLPGFEAALTGMSPGETREFDLTFPADYHGKEVAGKQAHFVMTLKSLAEPQLPDVDAEFARNFGIASGSLPELRSEIAANLSVELKRKVEGILKEQVMKALRSTSQLVVPKSLVEIEAHALRDRTAAELKARGVKTEELELTPDMFRTQAEDRVALSLVLNELVHRNALQARPEQIRSLVEEAAQSFEQPDAVIRWHYEDPSRLNEYEVRAVERNVIDWTLQRAKVEDQPTRFEALMEPQTAS